MAPDDLNKNLWQISITNTGIHNLADYPLTKEQTAALSLGFSFIPTPRLQKDLSPLIEQQFNDFRRRVRTSAFFSNSEFGTSYSSSSSSSSTNANDLPLKYKTSTWQPPPAPKPIEDYLTGVQEQLRKETERIHKLRFFIQRKCSSPPWLIRALKQIKEDKNILITEADKNMGTVVMSSKAYADEALRQLNDKSTYVTCEAPNFNELFDELELILAKHGVLVTADLKNPFNIRLTKLAEYLTQLKGSPNCKLGYFYMLMKVHKPKLAGRPIVSSIDTVTYFASKYLDRTLQPIYKRISSYIESSQALIIALDEWKATDFPGCALLCADIDSLYPNIPLVEGLQYMKESIQHHSEQLQLLQFDAKLIELICDLMHFVLHNNYFTFGTDCVLKQINGTAMGTPAAVVFACLFLDTLERKVIKTTNVKPLLFKRYIDDIFAIFRTCEDAQVFITAFNSVLPTIKCSSPTISNQDGIFLDLFIFKGKRFEKDRCFDTKLYQKPQNKYLYLTPNSFHPKSVFPAFIVAELNRYRLCCNNDVDFLEVKDDFYKRLLARGYDAKTLNNLFTRWSPRENLLQKVRKRLCGDNAPKTSSRPLVFKTQYIPEMKYFRLGTCLQLTDQILSRDDYRRIFDSRQPVKSFQNSRPAASFFRRSRQKVNHCQIIKVDEDLVLRLGSLDVDKDPNDVGNVIPLARTGRETPVPEPLGRGSSPNPHPCPCPAKVT